MGEKQNTFLSRQAELMFEKWIYGRKHGIDFTGENQKDTVM